MFSVTVRDHMMVAHSLRGESFGPAQRMHGATYIVDATFWADSLDAGGVVVDIGRARDALHAVLAPLNHRNLDDEPSLEGLNTTTEVLARIVAERIIDRVCDWTPPPPLTKLTVTLHESHVASASYEYSP